MKMRLLLLTISFFGLLSLQGCATYVNNYYGSKRMVISSSEKGTKVTAEYDGNKMTGANAVVITPKTSAIIMKGEKKGCETTERVIEPKVDWGWYIFGNIFSFPIFGWIFDPILGGLWYYEFSEYDVSPVCPE